MIEVIIRDDVPRIERGVSCPRVLSSLNCGSKSPTRLENSSAPMRGILGTVASPTREIGMGDLSKAIPLTNRQRISPRSPYLSCATPWRDYRKTVGQGESDHREQVLALIVERRERLVSLLEHPSTTRKQGQTRANKDHTRRTTHDPVL